MLPGMAPEIDSESSEIDPSIPPSGTGCVECLADLRAGGCICVAAPPAGISAVATLLPAQHATAHNAATGHPVIQSFEPGEDWFYDFRTGDVSYGPELAAPDSHPPEQPVPGPAGAVPPDWQRYIH